VHLSAPDRLDGTLIAEAIAGDDPQLGNPPGALGLAPEAEILSERIVPDYGEPGARNFDDNTFTPDMLATALRYAADHGANVVYIDWVPTSSDTTSLESAVRYALAKGVVITTWAERGENPADLTWPAATPGVIAAGTVELPAPFQRPGSTTLVASNDSVLVGVPGNAINELGPGDQPVEGWGNISAAAWIAGTAALIKSAYPHLPPVLVARAIALSARYHPRGGYRTTAGFGLINPYGALREAARLTPQAAMAGSSGVPVTAHFGSARQAATSPVARRTTVRLIGFWVLIGVGAVFVIAAAVRASKQFAER
jgi:hypothetical protein